MTDTTTIRDRLYAWSKDKPERIQFAVAVACWEMILLEGEDDPALRVRLAETMAFIREQAGGAR